MRGGVHRIGGGSDDVPFWWPRITFSKSDHPPSCIRGQYCIIAPVGIYSDLLWLFTACLIPENVQIPDPRVVVERWSSCVLGLWDISTIALQLKRILHYDDTSKGCTPSQHIAISYSYHYPTILSFWVQVGVSQSALCECQHQWWIQEATCSESNRVYVCPVPTHAVVAPVIGKLRGGPVHSTTVHNKDCQFFLFFWRVHWCTQGTYERLLWLWG